MGERIRRLKGDIQKKMGGGSLIEVYGLCEVLITGCLSMGDFSDECVFVETVDGPVKILGRGLSVVAFRADILCVKGTIEAVESSENLYAD